MNNNSQNPKTQDDILVYDFGISMLMWKDGQIWIRLDDVMSFMTDEQLDYVLARGVGLMANKSIGGTYCLYDDWLNAAPANAKPALSEVKMRMLKIIARE